MTYKEYFAPDEWATLKLSVLWIFQAISQADGRTDMREIEAMWSIRHNSSGFENELMREVLDTLDYDFAELLNRFNPDAWEIQNGLRKPPIYSTTLSRTIPGSLRNLLLLLVLILPMFRATG
jgi:hypothetical protein